MFCFGIGLAAHLILSFALIPRLSYLGAGIAFAAAELVIFLALFYFVSDQFFKLELGAILWKSALAGGLTYLFLFYLRQANLFLIAAAGTIIFAGLLLLLKLFAKQHLEIMKEAVFHG